MALARFISSRPETAAASRCESPSPPTSNLKPCAWALARSPKGRVAPLRLVLVGALKQIFRDQYLSVGSTMGSTCVSAAFLLVSTVPPKYHPAWLSAPFFPIPPSFSSLPHFVFLYKAYRVKEREVVDAVSCTIGASSSSVP